MKHNATNWCSFVSSSVCPMSTVHAIRYKHEFQHQLQLPGQRKYVAARCHGSSAVDQSLMMSTFQSVTHTGVQHFGIC